jgi:heptosyltransferase-2/heptosyltransferase-3
MPVSPPLRPTVFYFCRVGDMIMLTALLNLLHRRYRDRCQVIGAGSWNAAVFQGNPDVSDVWSFGRHMPFPLDRQWPEVARALRDAAPGPIYVCERHVRQLPRIRRMLAWAGVDPARCVFITDRPEDPRAHWIDRMVRFGERTPAALRAADYPVPNAPVWTPRLAVQDAERRERDAWLEARGWTGRPLVLVQAGNHRSMSRRRKRWRRLNTDDKAWPAERWVELLQRIHARLPQAVLLLRGAREEIPMLQEVQSAAGLDAVAVAELGLRPFFALCESAHSMISVDTGPAHAAGALSVPLVVMHGAGPPHIWAPRSPSGSPVVSVGGPPLSNRVDQITVDAVFNAWCGIVQELQPPARQRARARSATG